MGQAYNPLFSRIYDQRWAGFANQVAPLVRAFYEAQPAPEATRAVLDIGCGTGHLAYHFLEAGYEVTGLDLSPAMLTHARARCARYVTAGQAEFVEGDAAAFELPRRYGLAVATYDMLNHLPSMDTLRGAFASVRQALVTGGLFVFDLNTARGLAEHWSSIGVEDTEALFLLNRGIYEPEARRATASITGFVRNDTGSYERFEQVVYNTAFDLAEVSAALREAGWRDPYAASVADLGTPLEAPEEARRVFFVARL